MISVLYVDDEPDLLDVAQCFLESSGEFRVRTSTSARAALDSPDIRSYDVIISDYQMPGMDGIAFLKAVRERFADLPFILFTGRGREEVVIDALNNGADFYIQKGGDASAQFAELSNKIRYAVSRRRAEEELRHKNDELTASYEQIAANEEELRQQLDELTEKQEALHRSEEKFRAFTEKIPDLTTISDINGVHAYISPSIERITGRSADELIGKKFDVIGAAYGILPDDTEIIRKGSQVALHTPGIAVTIPPFRIRDCAGNILFIEGTVTYLPDVMGIRGFLFHGRDITDRVRAEEELHRKNEELNASYEQLTAAEEELRGQYDELAHGEKRIRESEVKFHGIFEQSHDALILFTEDGCIDRNQQALELYGFPSKEEILGLMPADVSSPVQQDGQDSRASAAAHLRAVIEPGVEHFEWLQQKKDGTIFPADVMLSAFELDGRQVFLSSVRDISERKRMEEDARENEATFRRVIEGAPEAICIITEGKFDYLNPAALRLFGAASGEYLVGTLCMYRVHRRFHDSAKKRLHQLCDERASVLPVEEIYIRLDGTEVDVEVSSVPFRYAGRNGALVFIREITGRGLPGK